MSDNEQPLEGLLRFLLPHAPTLPYEMALDMVRQAYIDFCATTSLVTTRVSLEVQRDVKDYKIKAPSGYEVYAIGRFEATRLRPHDTWGRGPRQYSVEGNDRIVLHNAPSKDYVMTDDLYVTLIPTETSTNILSSIVTRFGKGIVNGAIAEACDLPNQPFTNPSKAQQYRRLFAITKQKGRNLALTNRNSQQLMFAPIRVV